MTVLACVLAMMRNDQGIGPINLSGKAPVVSSDGVQAAIGTNRRACADVAPRVGDWIWAADGVVQPMRFRKSFDLVDVPKDATVFASADVRYRLWINGHLIARGPADTGRDYDSGAPGPWFDDVRTVSRFLVKGRNTIAAEVFPTALVQSEGSTGHPGFKCDLRVGANTIATDPSWRTAVAADLVGHNGPAGFRVDATLEPVGWQLPSFDDHAWGVATIDRTVRKSNLVSELAPPLEAVVPHSGFDRVSSGVVTNASGGARFDRDGGYSVRYPRVMSAYIALKVHGHRGTRLLIMPNEANAPGFNRRAEILLRDGEQTVELPFFDSFTTINIGAKGVREPVTIDEVRATFTSYPVRYEGSFECSDPELNRLWKVGRWVTQICMQTHHLDSPHHQEPISDPGDYLIEALNSYYAFGESALARQDLRKFARTLEQRHYQSFHTSYSLLWLQMLVQYYQYTGDAELVRELAPDVRALLDRFETYIGKNGLISNAPNYMFMDWVEIAGFNAHHPPAVVGQGYMTALYYRALADDAFVAELIGDAQRVQHDHAIRESTAKAFQRELWSESEGLYRDGKPHATEVKPNQWLPADKNVETFSTQVNTLAVCAGLADANRAKTVMNKVLARADMNCQPYFMHFVFEALDRADVFDTFALAQMRRWKVLEDSQSFLEMWNTGDRSHAWNATPLFQMSGRVLGVEPTLPGFKEFSVKPRAIGLSRASGIVPTPHGPIRVKWNQVSDWLVATVSVPKGTIAHIGGSTYRAGTHEVKIPK